MKKLKLNKTNFADAKVLSRAQLKKVMGGSGSGDICSSECTAIGSQCGTAERPGMCDWVSDSTCTEGGYGMCFYPI